MVDNASLQHALEIANFLESCQVEDTAGLRWRRTDNPDSAPVDSMYHGTAGIILFYLELYQATGDAHHLQTAVQAGDGLIERLRTEEPLTIGFYSGWPGQLVVLNELAKTSVQTRFRVAAQAVLDRIMRQSSKRGCGIGWVEPMPFSDITGMSGDREVLDLSVGSAGVGVALLYAYRQHLNPEALGWAIATADRLLELAIEMPNGLNWRMMDDMPFAFTAVNFAHGAAGVGYFLADLYRETEDQKYLDAALQAAEYVKSKTTTFGDGELVCHTEENPELFYLGVCHGPAGTGRFMYLLHEITESEEWLHWLDSNLRGLRAIGAPQSRSDGLWNNYGLCCGDAGIGDYALSLYRANGHQHYLDLAKEVEQQLLATSVVADSKRWWEQAEHRSRPTFLESQTGYMQGAAGIGSFFLHLATIDDSAVCKINLPETPFDS